MVVPKSEKQPSPRSGSHFLQVLLLSFSFMFIFTAFQTTGIIEETVLQSLRNETTSCRNASGTIVKLGEGECPDGSAQSVTFTGSGYTSLSIIYAIFSVSSWVAPSIVAITFPKWSMILMSTVYIVFIASFLVPATWLLYLLSVLLGAAAAVLWTAQGTFLSWISTPDTITRNSGVFWAINSCSLFFGNLLVYWQLRGKTVINSYLRSTIFVPLTIVCIAGVCLMCFLKNLRGALEENPSETIIESTNISNDPLSETEENDNRNREKEEHLQEPTTTAAPLSTQAKEKSMGSTAIAAFTESLQLFVTKNMLLLSLCSVYSGLEFSFLSGVYSTAVGNTKQLGVDSKKFVGLVGILTGVGEVIGGSIFGLLGSRTTKKGRTPIVILGAAVHFVSFTCIYFNIPDAATMKETNDVSFLQMPNSTLALFCAVLLGFGDACLQTQLIAIFASVYQDKSAAAFAIFKFTQSAASAAAFYTSSYLGVLMQMLVLFLSCALSAAAFLIVEWRTGTLRPTPAVEENKDEQLKVEDSITLNESA